jgi:hypothetical protein
MERALSTTRCLMLFCFRYRWVILSTLLLRLRGNHYFVCLSIYPSACCSRSFVPCLDYPKSQWLEPARHHPWVTMGLTILVRHCCVSHHAVAGWGQSRPMCYDAWLCLYWLRRRAVASPHDDGPRQVRTASGFQRSSGALASRCRHTRTHRQVAILPSVGHRYVSHRGLVGDEAVPWHSSMD